MRYSRGSSIDASPVGDRVVLYDRNSRKAVVLNPTGAWLWQALSTPQTADELSQQLHARFPSTQAAQVKADVEICLRDLTKQQLLHEEA
jgi:hypothetical protein